MEKDMNFWDLCVACGHGIGRACKAFGRLLAHMIRLSWRYWWLIILFLALSIAAALYYTRNENLKYKANAVALLNGPSIQQFQQAFAPLQSNRLVPDEAAIKPYLNKAQVTWFNTYRVIDCLDDETPDFIDFKHSVSPTDTMNVPMPDRLCLQFRIKVRDLNEMPRIEEALLEWFNSNEAMQQSFAAYKKNLIDEAAFNHRQIIKLDSLTSHYYYHTPSGQQPNAYVGNGVNFYGERRIHIFLDKIYDQQEHMQLTDYRMQLATAPVVLENHFSLDPTPLNDRKIILVLFVLLGWIGACILAQMIYKRKELMAWLRGE